MARTTGRLGLTDLLSAGLLLEGETLVLNRRSARSIEAVLQADGSIRVGESLFRSPSEAAREALAVGSVDGWLRWRVPRLGDCTLNDVRSNH